jgi:hypothetical protein
MKTFRLLLTSGAVAATLVLSACGGSAGTATNQNSSTDGFFKSLSALADDVGAKTSAGKSSTHMVMAIDAGGQKIDAQGDVKLGASPALEMTLALPGIGDAEMRLVDDVFYMKLPMELQPGKSWIKIDTNGTDPISKSLGASVKQIKEQGDPTQILKQMSNAGTITGVKREQLNGKDTTHYSITVDVKKLAESQKDPDVKKMMQDAADSAGLKTVPLEVWLDSENLPARITVDTPVMNPTTNQPINTKVTIDYSDWGKPVTVTAPPADEIGTMPSR